MPNKQQFLRVCGKAKVGRWFAFRKFIDPFYEILHSCSGGDSQTSISFGVGLGALNQLVVFFEGGRGERGIDQD